jgi:hypothetical protein
MAKQEVGLKIDVDVSSVGNMKQQLRAATNELVAMNEKFGSSSKEATQAAQRVAKLKDAIGDAKALADTFNPDKKFVALGGAVQGAVAGFSALQGAMGLFADKNKEVEQLLLKVQSAMALQQGLSGIAGSIDSFKLLAGTIKTQVVAAFTTLRGAMMATGIGLITSAVAFLVTNFDAVKNKLGELFPALKGAGDLMDRLKQIAMGVGNAIMQFLAAPISAIVKAVQGDFKGAFEALKNGVAFTKNFRAGEQKEIKDQADERERLRQEELKKEQEANKKKLEEQKRAAAERLRKLQEQQEKERQLREAADKVLREVELKGLTERQRQEATLLDEFNKNKAVLIAAGVTNFLSLETQYQRDLTAIRIKFETEEAERIKKANEKKLADDKARQEADINNKLSEFARIRNVTSDFNKAQVDAEIALQDAKFEAASAGLNALATLAQGNEKIANIFFAIDKALAIGKIIVDAQREISANMLYGASHPMNAIVPGSGAALGAKLSLITKIRAAASIATIVATTIAKFKSGGGASVPNPSGGGGGGINTTAPLAPQLTPQVTATAVNTAAVNQMGNQATRAYVLNSDIQNNDQRNAYIDRNASIG